jgi:UrcA family protein
MHRAIMISLIAAAAVAGGARAQSPDPNKGPQNVEIRVSYAGLDLTSEAGAKVFLKRLTSAADSACGGSPGAGVAQLSQNTHRAACRVRALTAAVAKVDQPVVSRLHAAVPATETIARR